jgi:transposase
MKQKSRPVITKEMLTTLRGNSSRERLLHRLHSVALVLNGSSASETARIYGDSPRAVAYWVTRFKRHGIEGLQEESRPGRPSTLNATQLKKLQTYLKQSGTKSRPVNAKELSAYILKEFGVSLTQHLCWRILKRLTA